MPQLVTTNTGAPVVTQGPMTTSAPLNVGIGVTAAAVTNYAVAQASGDGWGNAGAVLLNCLMQPLKKWFPILKQHEYAIIAMLIIMFVLLYFLVFDRNAAESLKDSAYATFQAIANYKSDKASGLNIMTPAED